MMLEDHLGDIIGKARKAANVAMKDAAQAGGISIGDLELLIENGKPLGAADLPGLAAKLQLNAAKLERIAAGWAPAEKDLSQWRELRAIATKRDWNTVNCFLVWDEVSREAALFDTGWEAKPILDIIAAEALQLRHLFLTHTHEDHIAALDDLKSEFPKLLLHTNDPGALPQHRNRANDFIQLGSLRISNRTTPGHASDGVTYIIGNWSEDAPPVAIIGDTIFSGSLANGFVSWDQLLQGAREQIMTLPDETLLCPGHGPLTTVAEEKENNPFF